MRIHRHLLGFRKAFSSTDHRYQVQSHQSSTERRSSPRPIGPRLASRQRRASLVTTIGLAYLGQPNHGRPSQAGDSRRDTVASAQSYSEADSDRRSAPETNMRSLKNRSFGFALTLPKQWVGRIGVQESKPLRILGLNTPIKQVRKLLTVSLLSRHSAFVCQCLWQGADALV